VRSSSRLFVSLIFLAASASAPAHSAFVRSEPADGVALRKAPNEIRIWFSEPIKVGLSTIEVRDAQGKQVDRGDLHADAKDPKLVRLSLAADLKPGAYRVNWNAVAQDLHPGKGNITFRILP
jgi:methionine-rich copper-binding protein CopC